MPDTQDFTTPHGGEQPARNPNHQQTAAFLETVRKKLLPLRQLESALTQSLLHPIDRLPAAGLIQRLADTGTGAIVGLASDADNARLLAILEWRQLPSAGGAE